MVFRSFGEYMGNYGFWPKTHLPDPIRPRKRHLRVEIRSLSTSIGFLGVETTSKEGQDATVGWAKLALPGRLKMSLAHYSEVHNWFLRPMTMRNGRISTYLAAQPRFPSFPGVFEHEKVRISPIPP